MLFIVLSALRKKTGVRYVFVGGFLALFLAFVNDILHNEEIIYTGIYLPHGQFFFIFSQSYLLFTEFSNLYIELSNKNKQLIQLDKLKDEFLANTSHELRTPLNGIIGITESLLGGVAGKVSEVMKTNLFLIYSSSRRLTSLVNDILDFQKLKNQDITLRTKNVDIKTLIDIVITLSQQLISKKDIKLISEIPNDLPELWGDENRIQQILFNLIDNAIKFTQEGEVRISATLEKDISNYNTNDFIKVTISDTGIGIPDDKKDDVFKSFEQLNSSIEREYGGTGLGLAISKKLMEMMGGTISLQSFPKKGSTFTISIHNVNIPSTSVSLVQNKEFDFNSLSFHKGSVLVVDDIESNRELLREWLKKVNLDIIEAKNGEEAVQIAKDYHPDLILMDIRMPKMNGYEATAIIRKNEGTKHIPIIALTASVTIEETRRIRDFGFDTYLAKPVDIQKLFKELSKYLSYKQSKSSAIKEETSENNFKTENIKNKPQLMAKLKKEMMQLWKNISEMMEMSSIETFAKEIETIGITHESFSLQNYAKNLFAFINAFDVIHIENEVKRFPKLVQEIEKNE